MKSSSAANDYTSGSHREDMAFRDIPVTNIFKRNVNSNAGIVINRGGARSSKSYSLAQLFVSELTSGGNKKLLVTRKTFPSLRITAYRDVVNLLKDYGFYSYCEHSKVEHSLTWPYSNNWMVFSGLDDPEKIKSTEWNKIWAEETTDFTYNDFRILQLRLSAPHEPGEINQLFMSFNPVSAFHWIKTEIVDKEPDVEEIVSSYLDNPFLPPGYVKKLLSLKKTDPNYWKIYGRGEWGVLERIIYALWNTVKPADWPTEFDDTIYGLDFGFNMESGLVEVNLKDGRIFEKELVYQTGLTNSKLIELVKTKIPEEDRNRYIFADSAEPDRIQEFCDAGFNCHPSDKAVKPGIDHVMSCDVNIHGESTNLIKEKRGYSWKTDKNGNALDEPVKWMDHLVDPERYALYTYHKLLNEGRPDFRVVDS